MRFRITMTTVVEYEVTPSNYWITEHDKFMTKQQMLDVDLENIRLDPAMIHTIVDDDDESVTVTGEILEEEGSS